MYNGIGLQTPRGSGTNGYIQTNKFFVKPRSAPARVDYGAADGEGVKPDAPMRKPNKEILEHSRKRQIELRLLQLQEKLEAQGYTEAEMAEKLQQARKDFEAESAAAAAAEEAGVGKGRPPLPNKRFADSQSHRSAALKEKQLEIFRAALDSGDRRRVRHDRREDSDKKSFMGDKSNEEERRYEFNQQKDDKNIINLKHKGSGNNSGKIAEGRTDKHGNSTRQNEPEDTSDLRDNKKRGNIKDEKSDYSDSDRDSGDSARKKLSKHARKHVRHDSDSDSDYGKHQKREIQKNMSDVSLNRRKSDKYNESDDSDYSDSDDSDSDSDHGAKYGKKYNRHDIDSDSDGAKHKKRENTSNKTDVGTKHGTKIKSHKEQAVKPKRYDTGSDSEGAKYKKNVIKSNNKNKKSSKNEKSQYSGSESYSSDSSKRERTKHAKRKRHAHYSDSDSDTDSEVAKNKKRKDIRNTKKSVINVSRKQGKSIGSGESDYVSSDTSSDDDKHVAKHGRHDSDSEEERKKSRDIRGSQKNLDIVKAQGKSNKYDKSNYSESESDSGDETRREAVQHVNKEMRYDKNLDSLDAKHKKELSERKGAEKRKYNSEDSDLGTDDEKNRRGFEKPSGSSRIQKNIDSMNESGKKDVLNDMKYGKSRRHYSDSTPSEDSEDKKQKSHEKDTTVKREHSSASNKAERNTQVTSRQESRDIYDPRKNKTEGGVVSEVQHTKTKDTAEGERWKEMGSKSNQNDGYHRSQRREDYAKGDRGSRSMIHEDEHASRKRVTHDQRYPDVRDHETRKREDSEKDISDRKAMRHEDDVPSRKRSRVDNSYEDKKRRYEGSPRHERHERYEQRKTESTRHHDSRDASRRHRD